MKKFSARNFREWALCEAGGERQTLICGLANLF